MSKDNQQAYITKGVSLEEAKKRAQETYDKVVKPQVEEERKLSSKSKAIVLSADQKAYANCHSPY